MNENWNRINKKIIINRSLLLIFSSIGILVYFTISFFHYTSSHEFLVELMYFTIWSNIIVFVWSIFGFISLFNQKNHLERKINHWFIKGTPFVWITITFFVFNFILLPLMITTKDLSLKESLLYIFSISIVHHFIVPILMMNDYRMTGITRKKEGYWTWKDIIRNISISTIAPLIWLVLSLILISQNIIEPQYFFMDLFGVKNDVLTINILILVFISIAYLIIFMLLFVENNKRKRKIW